MSEENTLAATAAGMMHFRGSVSMAALSGQLILQTRKILARDGR